MSILSCYKSLILSWTLPVKSGVCRLTWQWKVVVGELFLCVYSIPDDK